jgi:iron complex outermembrane recepter protein
MRLVRAFRLCLVPWFLLMIGTAVQAQAATRYDFRIEERTLGDALQVLSRVSGAQLIYPHEFGSATGINPVVGSYTVADALAVLLENSGFSGGLTESGMIVISLRQNRGGGMPNQVRESSSTPEISTGKRSLVRSMVAFVLGGIGSVAQGAQETEAPQLDEIVVTAQKREQSLSDVSMSVSAVGADALANSQTNSIESLQFLVPSISFGNDFNFAKLFIRGIGLNSSFPGADPSVALHVDGAVIAQAGAQMSAMFDLERVEVLRGPQGTLYGRNATGGAVNLITAKPTETLGGYGRLSIGGDDVQTLAEGALSGPLTDTIRARLAVRYLDREGYGVNELNGSDVDDAKQLSSRLSVQFLPRDDLDVLLTGEFHREDDRSNALKFRAAAFPNATAPTAPGQIDLRSLAALPGFSVASDPRNIRTNVNPINDRTTSAATATVSWDLAEAWMLRSISNYRDYEAEFYQDFDVSDYPGCRQPMVGPGSTCTLPAGVTRTSGNHWQPLYQHQFSEELQLNYEADRLHGLVAAYYLQEGIRIENHLGFNPVPDFSSDPADVRAIFDGSMDVETWAMFGNATYDLTEQFSLKGGARYSWEERKVTSFQSTATPPQSAPVPSALGYPWVREKDWSNFSPELGVEYRPQEGLLTYFTWAKGFKSGTAVIGEAGKEFVDPEKVDSFELGLKSKLLDNRLQLNVAAFYHEVEDAQFQFTFPLATPPNFTTQMRNAAQIEAKGLELESSWRLVRGFTLDTSVAWLDSEFTAFLAPNPLNPAGYASTSPDTAILQDLSGNRTRMSPEWSVTVHPTFDLNLNNGGSLTLAANAIYKDKQYHTEFNDDRMASDAYTLIDANILYTSPSDRYTVNLWAKNLTDEFVWAGSYVVSSTRTIGGTLLPPRTYGVTAGVRF